MKKFLVALFAALTLSLVACSTVPGTNQVTVDVHTMQVRITQACVGYGAALSTAGELRAAGKLSPTEINQITMISNQVTPICTTPTVPADPTVALTQVTSAVAQLGVLEAAHAIAPKQAASAPVSK